MFFKKLKLKTSNLKQLCVFFNYFRKENTAER